MKTKLFALLTLALFILSACTSSSNSDNTKVTGNTVGSTDSADSAELSSNDCRVAVTALENELNTLKEQLKTTESEFAKGVRRLGDNPDPAEEAKINELGDQLPELRKLIQNLAAALEEKKAACN